MAVLSKQQIEQKKQLLEEKLKEVKALYDELMEAGAIELPDDALGQAAGGHVWDGGQSRSGQQGIA